MPFDYEALVGHLYVVGGRAISMTPPGTLVEVAPKKAARGREADTFFALILPSGEQIAPAAFYEQMCRVGAERYFGSSGSVTAGLRSVFNSLNEDLYEHNLTNTKRYEASILCAVLRGSDLYLGRVGTGVALFRRNGATEPFPADFSNDEALFGPPLGVQPVVDAKMGHYEVDAGTRLILSDPGLADLDMDKLNEAAAKEDIAAVLHALKEMITANATLLTVEFVPPEAETPLAAREGESTALLDSPPPAPAAPDGSTPAAKPKRTEKMPLPLEPQVRAAIGKGALVLGRVAHLLLAALNRILPEPKEGQRSWLATPQAAGATVVIPVVVVVLVLALWVTGTDKSEFDLCVEEANKTAEVARGIASSDVTGTIAAWNAVIVQVEECSQLRSGDQTLAVLQLEGRQIIDRLLQVERREMIPITAFPNASVTRIVLQGEDIYALDDRNDLVYRIKVTPDGRSLVAGSQQAIPSMRRGGSVGQFTVGDILDIAWASDGAGLSQSNVLVALDANGVLVECPPRFLETLSCEGQRLLNTETWAAPKAIALWQGRLYLLDPGANQIWRYEPGGGAYTNSPTEYFVGEGRPDIRLAVDFGITDAGEIYILFANGSIKKFRSGQEVPFGYASFPEGQELRSADAMFLNNNPIGQGLLIVNRSLRTLYETTLAGTFIASYRPQDESMFTTLADAVVDPNQRMIYAASGNSILAFERTRSQQ